MAREISCKLCGTKAMEGFLCPECGRIAEESPTDRCKHYEVDAEAKSENDSWWDSMPEHMKREAEEFAAWADEHHQPTPMDYLPCNEFCKHYREGSGFPGETICCCMHPENTQMLHGYSVFDGVTDYNQRMRILDAIC